MQPERGRRLRRVFGVALVVLAFVATFATAVVLHLGVPAGRRLAGKSLALVLNRAFLGRFELAEVSELSLVSVLADGFRVRDPRGRLVLEGRGLRVRANVLAILRELLHDDGKTTLVVQYARVERANVVLAPMPGASELGLAAAFTPRAPSATPSTSPPPRVWLAAVEVGRANAHLELRGLPVLDGDVTGARGQVLISPVGVAVDAARFSAIVRGLLAKELRAVGSFHQRGTSHFWSSLDGYAGDLQFDTIARLDGDHLALQLDVPHAEPNVVRALLPSWPITETSTLHLEARGDLPKLAAKATGNVGDAALEASGSIELAPEVHLRLMTEGRDVDLRSVFADAPTTRITLRSSLDLSVNERGVVLSADGTSEPSTLGAVPFPATKFHVAFDPQGLTGNATLEEPGAPLGGTFRFEHGVLDFDAHASRFAIERAPRLAARTPARGNVEFRLKGRLAQQKLDATLSAELGDFTLGPLALGQAHVAGRAQGTLASPRDLSVDGSVSGSALRWGGLSFDSVEAKVKGPLGRLALTTTLAGTHGAKVEASARLSAIGVTELADVDVNVTRETRSLHGHVERVTVAGDALEIADVTLEGAGGTLRGSGRSRPGLLEADVRGQDLDLGLFAELLGIAGKGLGGKLNVNAEVALARDVRRGNVTLGIRDGKFGPVGGLALDLSTTLEGERLEGNAIVEVAGFGRLRSSFDTAVNGSLLDEAAWRRATGRLDIGVERLELAAVSRFLPREAHVAALGGALVAQVSVLREQPDIAPTTSLLAATDGLVVTFEHAGEGEPLTIQGIQAQLSGTADGTQDFVEADCRLLDQQGLLLTASGRMDVNVGRIVLAPLSSLDWLANEPVVVTAILDGRSLDELPAWARPSDAHGMLRVEAHVRGTPRAPVLSAKAALGALTFGATGDERPFDLCGTVQYDPEARRIGLGAQAYLAGKGGACSGKRVAVGSATGLVNPAALLRGERGFEGDAELGVEDAPLEVIPGLGSSGMVGTLRGAVALDERSALPALSARLELGDVRVRKVPVGSGSVTVRSNGRAVTADMALTRGTGTLQAQALASVAWDRALPRLDVTQPWTLKAAIHDIDAALLSPVVGSVLADLSGRLDGDVSVRVAPADDKAQKRGLSELTGDLSLKGGSLQLAGLGMRLSNVKFDASARQDGSRTVIAVRNLSAASGAKFDNVAATADVYLDGLKLSDARANVNLKRVPLMIEGVSQATLTGSAALELFPARDPVLVAIQLHDLTAELPRSSGRSVLSVDDNPDIVVKQPLREPTRDSGDGTLRWQLAFDLASKVKLVRSDLEIPLKGRPVVLLAEDSSVSGDLELDSGGRVQLLGKAFVIESGEVHFDTPDPGNPHLRVLASWRAPEGTSVYVEVGGTFREATLRLSSEPALSPSEIQALLLGGGSREAGEAQAAGLGYGAGFVGQLLADTPLKRVELRAGNEVSADERSYLTYTAAAPVSENVWVELSYKNLASTGPASDQRDAASATIDWRFKRDWSLRTEAGTIGTELDLLWQYRY